ncbi:hypothetical protein N7456_004064 [Penicillium angulare]|uniref:CRAL-TRIO domain-containing protein n=1 Tax=Penicillium angulare TaxID=116970 RepID=A0A9W9FVY2_9EURO|nr:hypothetical protein N7456_004064 [Penicillium angulare]
MTITPDTSTGHVHNLTLAQDVKLRELWILIFSSAASVLSAVFEVPLPDGSPNKLFEVLDRAHEPTVDAIVKALNGDGNSLDIDAGAKRTSDEINEENKEQQSLDNIKNLWNADAENNIKSEMTTRKVTPEHFAALFTELRKMGVQDSEIRSMENILSKMSPEEMSFSILKMIKQEHPDSLLLRFLRARKWDVGKAFTMMITNILWRKQMEVDDDILPKGELYAFRQSRDHGLTTKERKEGQDFIEQLKTGKSFLHGFDREGRPVNYVRVRIHKPGAQTEEALERYIVHVIESTRLVVVPPIENGTIVFDMTGFGLSNMEYQPVKFILKCFEANYPESLGRLLIHNAPWVFSGIWKLIHGWMDPVVASKVHFTRSVNDLDKFIPRDQIPKEIGGDKEWKYSYPEPQEKENHLMEDTETRDSLLYERLMIGLRMVAATAAWISATTYADEKEDAARVLELKARRNAIIEEFRVNYWKLDPYMRARCLLDRDGILRPDGIVGSKSQCADN